MKISRIFLLVFILLGLSFSGVSAQASRPTVQPSISPTASPEPTLEPSPVSRVDITQPIEENVGPLEKLLQEQAVGVPLPFNPVKYAIRGAVDSGVPPNTIVLLLLLPLIAAFIAAARHIGGIRGFGIFMPASLSVAFVAIGPILGIVLFVLIVAISTLARMMLRKLRIKLQYLPKMALILWAVVAVINHPDLAGVSIFPVLILVLLAEDFSKVQAGKSARTAISLATETIVLSLTSYIFLTTEYLQRFALLNPEILLLSVLVFDILLGKYIGLRFTEYWRYRKLIKS